jgi:hypothetical protein
MKQLVKYFSLSAARLEDASSAINCFPVNRPLNTPKTFATSENMLTAFASQCEITAITVVMSFCAF